MIMKIIHVLALSVALLTGSTSSLTAQGIRNGIDERNSAFQLGMREGLSDARNYRPSQPSQQFRRGPDRRDFMTGYNRGYQIGVSERARGWNQDRDQRDYRPDPYRSTGYGGFLATARQTGYQDGLNDGARDRRFGAFRPTVGVNFRNADRGFDSRYLTRNQYQQQYRVGYEQGYRYAFRGMR